MFFHRGWLYEDPVAIHEVGTDGIREIRFDPDAFDYGKNKVDRNELRGLGFAGFRAHFPVNTPPAPTGSLSSPVSPPCSTSTASSSCDGTSASSRWPH
jgi:glucan biosynthesis protein